MNHMIMEEWMWWTGGLVVLLAAAAALFMYLRERKKKRGRMGKVSMYKPREEWDREDRDVWQDVGGSKDDAWKSSVSQRLEGLDRKIERLSSGGVEDKRKLDQLGHELEQKKIELAKREGQIKERDRRIEDMEMQNKTYADKVLQVPELQQESSRLLKLIEFLQEATWRPGAFYMDSLSRDAAGENIVLVAKFLAKHQATVAALGIGKWQQVCRSIKEAGCIVDKGLVDQLRKEEHSQAEKIRFFRRNLIGSVLEAYINSVLILCEELRNLRRFSGKDDEVSRKGELEFSELSKELIRMAKLEGQLDINYVPLFDSYEDYMSTKRVVEEPGVLYRNIATEVERNAVIEVKAYGIYSGNEFGEKETKILIKK